MRNIALKIAYEGTHFLGWQKTPKDRTVEGVLQSALEEILKHPVSLQAASRTDAGVHAEGQVVNFFTACTFTTLEIQTALLHLLPKDLTVLEAAEKDKAFHPTLNAKGKIYRYEISTSPYQLPCQRLYAWHYPYPLNLFLLEKASQQLLGSKDFTAFCNDSSKTLKNPICHLQSITFKPLEDRLAIFLEGDRFLYKMVRNLVGTLCYIGSGKLPPDAISSILLTKDRTLAGITAPAHGLTLYKVNY